MPVVKPATKILIDGGDPDETTRGQAKKVRRVSTKSLRRLMSIANAQVGTRFST